MNVEGSDHEGLAHRFDDLIDQLLGIAGPSKSASDDREFITGQSRQHMIVADYPAQALGQRQ